LLRLDTPSAQMTEWRRFVQRVIAPRKNLKVAVVGKYIDLQDAYKSIYESLTHAGAANDCGIEIVRIDAEDLEGTDPAKTLGAVAGIIVPGGFGDRGVEGKIAACNYAREKRVPYLGLCLGMQVATIEFARNVCGFKGANSTEFEEHSPHPVICLLEDQKEVRMKGASMRLGSWPTDIVPGTLAAKLYGKQQIIERHRHRYEFNLKYKEAMEEKGFVISGTSPDARLVELIELRDHPWFVACQYHPEFLSKPNAPHPLFRGFIAACLASSE
jgi:CTP synthase